jgi:hypothetical protein
MSEKLAARKPPKKKNTRNTHTFSLFCHFGKQLANWLNLAPPEKKHAGEE